MLLTIKFKPQWRMSRSLLLLKPSLKNVFELPYTSRLASEMLSKKWLTSSYRHVTAQVKSHVYRIRRWWHRSLSWAIVWVLHFWKTSSKCLSRVFIRADRIFDCGMWGLWFPTSARTQRWSSTPRYEKSCQNFVSWGSGLFKLHGLRAVSCSCGRAASTDLKGLFAWTLTWECDRRQSVDTAPLFWVFVVHERPITFSWPQNFEKQGAISTTFPLLHSGVKVWK